MNISNTNKEIRVGKITLNIGAGKDQAKLEKGISLLKHITGTDPVKTFAKKRIPNWGLRPGLPIGCKLTLRHDEAIRLLPRLLSAKGKKLSAKQFDNYGNVAFGIHEYIDIPEVKYEPKIGVMGLEVCISLERNGYRIKMRSKCPGKIPARHIISRDEAVNFIKQRFEVDIQ